MERKHSMMKSKAVTLFLSLSLVTTVAACGATTDGGEEGGEATPTPTESPTEGGEERGDSSSALPMSHPLSAFSPYLDHSAKG